MNHETEWQKKWNAEWERQFARLSPDEREEVKLCPAGTLNGRISAAACRIANDEPLTVKLNNGVTVLAKLYKGEPSALHFSNRTQAQRRADAAGKGWQVRQFGRPFYVMKLQPELVPEHFPHDVCPACDQPSVPAEGVPDQALRGEDLDRPATEPTVTITPAAAAVQPLRPGLPDEPDAGETQLANILKERDAYRKALQSACGCIEASLDEVPSDAKEAMESDLARYRAILDGVKSEPLRVVVEVTGGVAEVTACPAGVECEIIDHDN